MQSDDVRYPGLRTSIFAGAFVFGIVMSTLGAILPVLFDAIGFEKIDAGSLFLVMNFGMLLGSLSFGPICDRFGFRAVLLVSTFLVGAAFAGLASAGSFRAVVACLAVLGFGGGALNGGTNALLNDISPDRRASALNLLGIFFGFGALVTPFLIGSLLEWAGMRRILVCLVVLALAPLVLFLMARFPGPKHQGGLAPHEIGGLIANPLLLLFGFLLFCQSGNEFTVGGWVSTYLGERLGFNPRSAAYALGGYWAAMMAGRWAVSRVGSRISSPVLVVAGAALALLGSSVLITAGTPALAALAVGLVGLGFAPVFPTTLAQAGAAFAAYSGSAFSVIFVMALAGGMSAPWLFGRISQSYGIGAGFWVTAGCCAAIIVLQLLIRATGQRRRPFDPTAHPGL